jgi:phage gp46-like protein
MSDFVLEMIVEPNKLPRFELATSAAAMTEENSLQTAVIISLFTDRLANVDDVPPDSTDDRRGWWADSLAANENDNIGSRLWLLDREKETANVLRKAEEYTYEALEWLVEDAVASAVRVVATNPRDGWLNLNIQIDRPGKETAQYNYLWEALNAV